MNAGPGADEARVGEVEDGPEVAEAVLDRRAGEGDADAGRDAAQLLGGLVGRVLDGLRLVEHDAVPLALGERLDVADRGAVGGDDDVGLGDLVVELVGRWPATAPWCTTTRSSGVNRAASAAQLPTTAGGAMTSAGPLAGGAGEVGEHGRASCRGPCRGRGSRRARRRRGSRASRAPRPGSCAARRRSPRAWSTGLGRDRRRPCSSRSVAQPLPSTVTPPAERRALEADGVAQDLGAGELRRGRPARRARRPPP